MSPFGIITLVFISVLFVLALVTFSFFAGASIMKSHYRSQQQTIPQQSEEEAIIFTRRWPE